MFNDFGQVGNGTLKVFSVALRDTSSTESQEAWQYILKYMSLILLSILLYIFI